MRKVLLLILIFVSLGAVGQDGGYTIGIQVIDSISGKGLSQANVIIQDREDASRQYFGVTNESGFFKIQLPKAGNYYYRISFIGYRTKGGVIAVKGGYQKATVGLQPEAYNLKEVTVKDWAPPVKVVGDTTEFRAESFKTHQDASVEDLVTKMPGIVVEDGTVKAHGEEIKKVLVDGYEFFGSDPSIALKNLPAEIIERVQVFDKMSDQAQFSGFDDGNSQKTMNIITKPSRRNGKFGKLFAGYGTDHYYQAGGMYNKFNGDNRISIITSFNNVNRQNFTREDMLGAMSGMGGGRRGGGGGGGALRGPLDQSIQMASNGGINSTNSFGINYQNKFGEKLTVSASYFFNYIDNENESETWRDFLYGTDSLKFYSEKSESGFYNFNNRLNARIIYDIDENNSIILLPQASFQNNESFSFSYSETFDGDDLLNATETDLDKENDGYNLGNTLIYRHKFGLKGRTISLMVNNSYNKKEGEEEQQTIEETFGESDILTDYDLDKLIENTTSSIRSRLVYTEPVGQYSQVMLTLGGSFSDSENEKWVFSNELYQYTLDPTLSNVFSSTFETYFSEAGYRFNKGAFNITLSLSAEKSKLKANREYPESYDLKKSFTSFRPRIWLNWKPGEGKNLMAMYNASTQEPSANQLQDVVDNSEPLFLTTGNPNLSQQTIHRAMARYTDVNAETGRNVAFILFLEIGSDYIVNHTYTNNESVPKGYTVPDGGQLTIPENMDGYWDLKGVINFGTPVTWLGSNLSLNTDLGYNRTPGMVNDQVTKKETWSFNQGVQLSSNISEDLDFSLFWNGGWDEVHSTLDTQEESYYTQTSGCKVNWIFGDDWVFNSTLNHLWYVGLSESIDPNYTLLNASLGKKIFKDRSGEIKLGVYDILKENQSISRTVTETYEEQSRSLVVQRYAMVTFTWTFRDFFGQRMERPERPGLMEGPPGDRPFPMGRF
ncbi:outer membrane beta-barrel protein [Thermophagus xiamenensis]|uniref:CarboxypepD_reg-like domain-containing protein n=1 Tax=Thermophagus xiamenensis TaxID=385682 RepID=A0A1I2E2E8_9BACT|nr:outer membrane beta-barrel protein [Thermophagus xiamenensis]SFE87054.1 CarboxypepD_reg-like domain-containing protein [Thermophagus xiamenensis]